MAKLIFTPEELKLYFTAKKYHYYWDKSKAKEQDMKIHADGIFPEKMIRERRPNEPLTVLDYRISIFVAKTKPYFDKILNTLQKIRRSSDWSIKYPQGSFDKIIEGEKLDDYLEDNYSTFESLTNWVFSYMLRCYLIDPNSLLLVAPLEIPTMENEFLKPVCTVFSSCEVIDYIEGDYAVMENRVGCWYYTQNRMLKQGKSFYVITTKSISRYDQINGRGEYSEVFYFEHELDLLPVFKIGATTVDVYGNHVLYESRISGILPEFNEALREYSDLQAAKVLHLYPERWEYTQNECVKCKGTGQRIGVVNGESCQVTCDTCGGQGYIASGPYSKMLIRPNSADQLQVPTPPAGFVEKDVEIIKLQEVSVEQHIYNALASINFEFLTETPLNQSGKAKEVDRDDLNTMVHSIAEDIVRVMDKIYYIVALYRYQMQYTAEEIYEMLPDIAVPEKFDILSTKYFDEMITSAINNKLNPAILNQLQVSYATKVFNNDLDISSYVGMILNIDPLAGISEDDKMSRLSNEGITKLDYVVSSNINKFVAEAVEANPEFDDLEITQQKEIIYAMAQEQIDSQVVDVMPLDQVPLVPIKKPEVKAASPAAPVNKGVKPVIDIDIDSLIPNDMIVKGKNRVSLLREKAALQKEIDILNSLIESIWG